MLAPLARIFLRYAAGPLLLLAFVPQEVVAKIVADPDVVNLTTLGLGAAIPILVEGWYFLARKFGWSK
jgi:hypothetical protein